MRLRFRGGETFRIRFSDAEPLSGGGSADTRNKPKPKSSLTLADLESLAARDNEFAAMVEWNKRNAEFWRKREWDPQPPKAA